MSIFTNVVEALTRNLLQVAVDLGMRSNGSVLQKLLLISMGIDAKEQSIDNRILKIDAARKNLMDAISAIDDLEQTAREQKASVEELQRQIDLKHSERNQVRSELDTVKAMQGLDVAALRKVLGFPSATQRWVGRISAFVVGVAASYLASWLWTLSWPLF